MSACLEKLDISGIRSFSPELNQGSVELMTPVTLILGPNGTGKTTIIESLRYVTTGQFPPGSKGAGFVHDPKIAHETEVKAQVRLRFRNTQGLASCVTRSLIATQKPKGVTVRSLDGVFQMRALNGEKAAISSKCLQLDREMVAHLGVSRAILDNVIFCHQEDSNWPLGESKQLKQKFEDIFACTRYAKALDNINSICKKNLVNIKVLNATLKGQREVKNSAQKLRSDLQDAEVNFQVSSDSRQNVMKKMKPISEKLNELRTRADEIQQKLRDQEKLRGVKREMEKNQRDLRGNIEHEFLGPLDELKENISRFEERVKEREDKLRSLTNELEGVEREMQAVADQKNRLLHNQGSLQQAAKDNQMRVEARDKSIRSIAFSYELDAFTGDLDGASVELFLSTMSTRAQETKQEAKKTRREFEARVQRLQKEINELQEQKTKLDYKSQMNTKQLSENSRSIQTIERDLMRIEASADHLDDLQDDLDRALQDLSSTETSVNVEALKSELNEFNRQKSQLNEQMRVLEAELSRISLETTDRAELGMMRKEHDSKNDQIRRLKSKNKDSMELIFGTVPDNQLRSKLDAYLREQNEKLCEAKTKLQTNQDMLTKLETQRTMYQEKLFASERIMREKEEQIFSVCESQDFDEGIQQISSKLRTEQDEKGYLNGITHIYRKYIERLQQNNPGCPVCHRPFDSEAEIAELVQDLEQKVNLVPSKLQKKNAAIATYKEKHESMLQLKPVRTSLSQLKEKEIPQLHSTIQELTAKLKDLKSEVEKWTDEVSSLECMEAMARNMQADAGNIDKCAIELKDWARKIQAHSSRLTGSDSSRTLSVVEGELQEARIKIESLNKKVSNSQDRLSRHSESVHRLRSEVNKLTGEKLQIEKDLQERIAMETNLKELKMKNINLEKETKAAREDVVPLQDKIREKCDAKDATLRSQTKQWDESSAQINKIEEHRREIQRFQDNIEKFLKEGGDEKLERSKENAREMDKKIRRLVEKKDEMTAKADKIKDDLASQQVRERELNDNLKLREKKAEIEQIDVKLRELDELLDGLGGKNVQLEINDLDRQKMKLDSELRTIDTRYNVNHARISDLKGQLGTSLYKNADEDFANTLIELKTTETTNKDLAKYNAALETRLNLFHAQKMKQINGRIKDLWRETYRGNDIDTIEIRTSDDDEGPVVVRTNRRTYNYRVVMVRGDVVLDMRGRCSAGQKVLACLIIRLALAETFCDNFGFLALDEPTTNLDVDNIRSLALSLVRIIENRREQSNFQLLIITHDEEFVELIGRANLIDDFYRVSKDHMGYSKVSKYRIQDLDAH